MGCISWLWMLCYVWWWLSLGGCIPADHGYMENCDPNANNFTFYWTPEYIVVSHTTTVFANFTAPVDWSSGVANCTGTVPTCVVPVFQKIMNLNCDDVPKAYTGACPIKKGDNVNWLKHGHGFPIESSWPIPEDNYTFVCTVKNQKGELFLCAKGPVKVKDPPQQTHFFQGRNEKLARADQDRLRGTANDMHQVHIMDQGKSGDTDKPIERERNHVQEVDTMEVK